MQLEHEIIRTVIDLSSGDSISVQPALDRVTRGDHCFSLLLNSGPVIDSYPNAIIEKLLIRGLTRKQLSDLAQDILRSLS